MDKLKALKKIIESAKEYDRNLKGKIYLIISYSDIFHRYSKIEVKFDSSNFLHLTGVKTKNKANEFYKKCISNKLSMKDFSLKDNGTTALKLQLLPDMFNIKNYNTIGLFNNDQSKALRCEKVAGNKIGVLGLKKIDNEKYIPITLLKDDIVNRIYSNSEQKIIAIYLRDDRDNLYSNQIYITEDFKISLLPENISKLIAY